MDQDYRKVKDEIDKKAKHINNIRTFLLGSATYGILITLFVAVQTESFTSDFLSFFSAIGTGLYTFAIWLLTGAEWLAFFGDMIPQEILATIIHWLLYIIFLGIVGGGTVTLVAYGCYKLTNYYKKHLLDWKSIGVILVSLALIVFFAEPIRAVVQINLILLLIIFQIIYIVIRAYINRHIV